MMLEQMVLTEEERVAVTAMINVRWEQTEAALQEVSDPWIWINRYPGCKSLPFEKLAEGTLVSRYPGPDLSAWSSMNA
jgi:hypothetical protein